MSYIPVRKWANGTVADTVEITGVTTPVTASGNSAAIDIAEFSRLICFVQVGTPTGTSPTLDVVLETQEPHGTWLAVITFTQLTSASYTYGVVGPGAANTYVLSDRVRFRWTIGGTDTPTFPSFLLSVVGRRA